MSFKRSIKFGLLRLPARWGRRKPCVYVNTNPALNQGPNVFVRKLASQLSQRGMDVSYWGLRGCNSALLINNTWGAAFYALAKRWRVRVTVRMDGFYPPVYFDDRPTPKFHQDRRMTAERRAFNESLKADFQLADHVVYQSAWSKDMCDRYLLPRRDRFSIVHNGVDLQRFHPVVRKRDPLVLLSVGNLRHEYMLRTVLAVYRSLASRFALRLHIAGTLDAINNAALQEFRAAHVELATGISYLGAVPNDRLPEVYQSADVFVHPRAGDCCPNVVVESLASGVPVVCPRWGGAAELLGEGGVAVDAEPWDYSDRFVELMTEGTQRVLQNLSTFQREARLQAERSLDVTMMSENYIKVLVPNEP